MGTCTPIYSLFVLGEHGFEISREREREREGEGEKKREEGRERERERDLRALPKSCFD